MKKNLCMPWLLLDVSVAWLFRFEQGDQPGRRQEQGIGANAAEEGRLAR